MKWLNLRCELRDIIKTIVIKEVSSIDVHIALMNLPKNSLIKMYKDYNNKQVCKMRLLVNGGEYYKENYGMTRYESAYRNFFICFKTNKIV